MKDSIPMKIKVEILRCGTSQTKIARTAGVSVSSIHDVITGRRKTYRIRAAIAEAIGRKISEIWPTASQEISQTHGRGKQSAK